MKFTWFNLMPWPYLPDDFREKNHSVWVDIDQKLFDPVKSHEVYNTYLDLMEYAGTLGFDGIGCNEHHQNGYGLMPSPNLIAAALARRTKDVALVVLGNSIALYNPPIRVAEEFAMLDCISGGRLVGGLSRRHVDGHEFLLRPDPGAHPREIPGSARPHHARVARARTVRVQRPLQQIAPCEHLAAGPSSSPIRRSTFPAAAPSRPMISASITPIPIPTCRSPATSAPRRSCRAIGSGSRSATPPTIRLIARASRRRSAWRTRDAEAERLYKEHVLYFYNRCLHVYPGFADAPGYRTIKTIQSGALSQYAPPQGYADVTWKELTEGGHVIAGSPETVRQRIEELAKSLHVGNSSACSMWATCRKRNACIRASCSPRR